MRPSAPGSGKFGTQWLRMHAENACGLPEPELLEDELLALLVVPICATFAADEPPPHPAASSDSAPAPRAHCPRSALRFSAPTVRPSRACSACNDRHLVSFSAQSSGC
jgi:hypothetical protein